MSLPFINQAIQTIQQFPITQQTNELRLIYQTCQQSSKQLGKFKIDNTFWNQDITKVEIEISKILHEFGYRVKPNPIHQFNFDTFLQKKARLNITTEDYREALLQFYENLQANLWIRRKYLLRQRIALLHNPTEDVLFYDPLVKVKSDVIPIEMYSTVNLERVHPDENKTLVDEEIKMIDEKLVEYAEISEKLSNERIFDPSRFDQDIPQIQISTDDDLIFERMNNKIYQSMPFITQKHLKEYYNFRQNLMVNKLDDLDTQIFIESLESTTQERASTEYCNMYLIPVTMPQLQQELQQLAYVQGVDQDITVDNGALFLFAIDKHFVQKIQDQSNKYLLFLPYNLDQSEQKTKSFQQQTMNILNELKEDKIRKNQYRIRSSAHWLDNIQIIQEKEETEMNLIFNQYEDSAINSWMKFLLYHESDKIQDKINKDVSLVQEKVQSTHFPEIYFQFFLRYQKLLYLESRESLIQIMHCYNVMRTMQKNLNIYFIDLHQLSSQLTKERIQKKQQNTLNAFITSLDSKDTIPQEDTSAYFCEEKIQRNHNLYEVMDGNGHKIIHEIVFKDVAQLLDKISHISAFTLQFTNKIGEKNSHSDSQQLNRFLAVKDLLQAELDYNNAKCKILQIVFPLLSKARVSELANAVSILARLIQQQPQFRYDQNVLIHYSEATRRLNLLSDIFTNTKSLKLILKLFSIKDINILEQTLKYIKRDRLIDKEFPYKSFYKDSILDSQNNLSQILKQLPEDGNFNIFSLLEFLLLRRRFYKLSLRIYYLSNLYGQQIKERGLTNKMIQKLEVIPNRVIDDKNFDVFTIVMDEYLKIGKECQQIELWTTFAADNYKMIDMLMPLKSLLLLDFYLFNAIKINRKQTHHFVDIIGLKEKLALQAQSIQRKANIMQSSTAASDQNNQDKLKQTAISMISTQFRGSLLVKNFVNKIQQNQSTALQEFNKLLTQQCQSLVFTLQALGQRDQMIQLNQQLPFVKPLFTEEPFLNEMKQIQNPFIIHSIPSIMNIINFKDFDSKPSNPEVDNLGDEDWVTTTRLKLEKNVSPLSANRKQPKFKSSGNPFSNNTKFQEPISGSQQLALQLVQLLIGVQSCNCNVQDLIYLHQGMLGMEELKRNQLRLRRDLESVYQQVQKYKDNIAKILLSGNIQNMNLTIMTYLEKLIKRFHLLITITMISSVHQFRKQIQDNSEIYPQIISTLRNALITGCFRNMSHVERLMEQAPKVYPSIQTKKIISDKMMLLKYAFGSQFVQAHQTNPNNVHMPLQEFRFEDFYTQLSPYMIPSQQILFRTQKINYNVESFLSSVVDLFPIAMANLFTLFPQSKLIYYSTIQDLIISESESILRDKCIFEVDDLFKYERAYRKLLVLQFRYLLLSEFFTVQKRQILPFSSDTSDPCTQWLENCVELCDKNMHKQQLKAGLLLSALPGVNKQVNEFKKGSKTTRMNYEPSQEKFSILPRLRLESFENQVFQLISMMIGCQAIFQEEGKQYYQQLNNQLNKMDQPYQVAKQLNVFYSNLERDSLKIMTLNKGYAHVIADSDLDKHLNDFNRRMLDFNKANYPSHVIIENESLQRMYNQKSIELRFAMKKIKFYESNINHIVESLVAQRTNDLIFENDALKQQIEQMMKSFDIEKQKQRDKIKEEFSEQIRTQEVLIQQMQNRFQDYKRGISMEMTNFIQEYKTDGLKRVRDKASEALFGQVNKLNIDLDVEYQRVGVYDKFKEDSEQVNSLFSSLKKLRTFYLWKEMCIRERFEKQIQIIVAANSSNEELQQKIQQLTENVEILKDELIQNRKIITIMDNQNQILRRDLQKLKIERFQAMREKGQLGAIATYQDQEQQLEEQRKQVIEAKKEQQFKNSRPITASSITRSIKSAQKVQKLSTTQSVPKLGTSQMMSNQKGTLTMKYKITS
ncbi:unnamed protein product (macronuclear) [Paramecium tetraurelia]|uniref:Uncharacterized protein n=1 Tax=Paramecium tetraurelia TaxID=5888 RepID=A0DLV5_PARTE|nr:uncharacterized protein GSPATT00039654001 [Paramecium tetraurelia]CAK84022.1 unnamed protein product [Paramecium tetraurelia]|eukprot:XP_001451419.1 hypothetical protein (macronuclear) [Paramecium tetraurelia strain d4-2]